MFTAESQLTAPDRSVEAANGVYAYRRLGDASSVLRQHDRGNLDNGDPALADALLSTRPDS